VMSYSGTLSANPNQPLDRHFTQLAALLSAIQRAGLTGATEDPQRIREALKASVIRASIMDVPWSAAFVSAVLRDAGVPGERFTFSAAHIDYITQAVGAAAAESRDGAAQTLYRACDPYGVQPRPGDLLCYHRQEARTSETGAAAAGSPLFQSIVGDIADGQEPVRWSHCDIVTRVDERARKVRLVGGNVQQAVSARVLNLNRSNVLSTNQGTSLCAILPWGGASGERACSLNAQPWFVLLQSRGV